LENIKKKYTMNKIDALLNNYETFSDNMPIIDYEDDIYYNKSPEIIELESIENDYSKNNISILKEQQDDIITTDKPIIEELQELNYNEVELELNKYHESFNIDYLLMKYQDEMNEKYKEKVNKLSNDKLIIKEENKIIEHIKYELIKWDNRRLLKQTKYDEIECNIYGEFFRIKKDCKIRVSYIYHNGCNHYIKIINKIIDARVLMFETFVCSSQNLILSFKKGNINELKNISFKIDKEQNLNI
jgi:hypothetical protein